MYKFDLITARYALKYPIIICLYSNRLNLFKAYFPISCAKVTLFKAKFDLIIARYILKYPKLYVYIVIG